MATTSTKKSAVTPATANLLTFSMPPMGGANRPSFCAICGHCFAASPTSRVMAGTRKRKNAATAAKSSTATAVMPSARRTRCRSSQVTTGSSMTATSTAMTTIRIIGHSLTTISTSSTASATFSRSATRMSRAASGAKKEPPGRRPASSRGEQPRPRIGVFPARQLAHQDPIARHGVVAEAERVELHHAGGADREEHRRRGDTEVLAGIEVRLDQIAVAVDEEKRLAVERESRLGAAVAGDAHALAGAPERLDIDLRPPRLVRLEGQPALVRREDGVAFVIPSAAQSHRLAALQRFHLDRPVLSPIRGGNDVLVVGGDRRRVVDAFRLAERARRSIGEREEHELRRIRGPQRVVRGEHEAVAALEPHGRRRRGALG